MRLERRRMENNPMLGHALKYLEMGYPIFPINFDGRAFKDGKWTKVEDKEKSPLIKSTDPFWERLPTKEEVTEWWTTWPWAAIGLACGKLSGLTVVDCEVEADFNLFGLEDIETVTAKSGRDGKHYYFKYEPNIPNRVKFAPYYDIRSEKGYIIVPPSPHVCGGKYEWIEPIGTIELAPFPERVKNAVKTTYHDSRVALEKIINEGVKEGARNDSAASFAGSLLSRYPQNQWSTMVWPILQMWNKEKNFPPEDEDALFKTFASICKSELSKRNAQGEKAVIFNLEPVSSVTEEVFTVEFNVEDAKLRFEFEQSEFGKNRALDTQLTASYILSGFDPIQISARININSLSSRSQMSTELARAFGKKYPWAIMLSNCAPILTEYIKNTDQAYFADEIDPGETPEEMLFDPFIFEGSHNLVHADGSAGKSTLLTRLAISLASGEPFLDYTPKRICKVLYLDYEDNDKNFRYRLSKLMDGVEGLSDTACDHRIIYYKAKGTPIFELWPKLKLMLKKHEIDVLIIDSVAYACGDELERAETATRYFNTLDKLGVTTLSIAHVSKGTAENGKNQKYAIGSIFWHNGPRNIWNLRAEEQEDDLEGSGDSVVKKVCLFHKKNNLGPRHRAIPLEYCYGHKNKIIINAGKFDDWRQQKKTTIKDRVVSFLREGDLSTNELIDQIGCAKSTFSGVKDSLLEEGIIEKTPEQKWHLKNIAYGM